MNQTNAQNTSIAINRINFTLTLNEIQPNERLTATNCNYFGQNNSFISRQHIIKT